MSHIIFSPHPPEEGCNRVDWWAPGIQPISTLHNDTESHTSFLSLYLVHHIGSTQKTCEYRSFTLAKTTLIACFILSHNLFCSCLHSAESCSLWGTRGVGLHLYFYLSVLKPWHKTSLYRHFWQLAEYSLRQQWNRYTWWHQLPEVSQLQLQAKVLPINSNYVAQLNSVCIPYMLHEVTDPWERVTTICISWFCS